MINKIPNFPALDMFVGVRSGAYRGFGGVIEHPGELSNQLRMEAAQTREEIRKTFHVKLENPVSIT